MSNSKQIFENGSIRCGGYFELAIQVSQSTDNDIVPSYKKYFWDLPEGSGPFDPTMQQALSNPDEYKEEGLLNLKGTLLPFVLYYVKETEPLETGFNWFVLSFYTATLDHVFSLEGSKWTTNVELAPVFDEYLDQLMKALNSINPFKLAMKDFEISGEFYLHDLGKPKFQNWTNSHFFVPGNEFEKIQPAYYPFVTVL